MGRLNAFYLSNDEMRARLQNDEFRVVDGGLGKEIRGAKNTIKMVQNDQENERGEIKKRAGMTGRRAILNLLHVA